MSSNEGEPAKFIRDLKDKSSILLFYEEQKYARSLGFLFLDIGLKDDQLCLYLSCDPTQSTEKEMVVHGINVSYFKANNRLRIHNITNQKIEHVMSTIEDFVRDAENHTSRIVIQRDRFTKEQHHDLMLIEDFVQTLFERHDVSVLNSYNTEFMDNAKFMQQMINMHGYTIFAPDFGKGIVIKTK